MIHLPVVDMREQAILQSKVVSQALFGESVQISRQIGDWACVMTSDEYLGWVPQRSLLMRCEPYPKDIEVARLSAHIYAVADTEYGPLMTLPYGSKLEVVNASDTRWYKIRLPDGQNAFIQRGDVETEPFDLLHFSKKFLGLPYTWGGRSSFGFDCSGFVQMLYGRLGIRLPRDAEQQILDPQGQPVALEELKLGDLIFWGSSEEEVKHVGMYLEGEQFIHTSPRENKPYVRISRLSDFEWSSQKEAFYSFRGARRYLVS